MMDFSDSEIKVAVVAVLKDEAPYIADWIHHYIYFGFKGVFLGVNRTSDASEKILNKISEKYPEVKSYCIDWLDEESDDGFNITMQERGYEFLTEMALKSDIPYSHILYVDIDELWFDMSFELTISDLLNKVDRPFDLLSFNWLNQTGDNSEFEPPFRNKGYNSSCSLKTLVNVNALSKVAKFRPHVPLFKKGHAKRHIDANGGHFIKGRHAQIFQSPPDTSTAILHRLNRSENEYIALLAKKNPNNASIFKINRKGFSLDSQKKLQIPEGLLDKYWKSLDEFKAVSNINEEIKSSQSLINTEWLNEVIQSPEAVIPNLHQFFLALDGTSAISLDFIRKFSNSCEDFLKNEYAMHYYKAANTLENMGLHECAYLIMKLANKSRPNGKVIKEKLNQLESKL